MTTTSVHAANTAYICNFVMAGEFTDYVCIVPARSHVGPCEFVDAMGFKGVDSDGKPVYRAGGEES